MSLGGTDLNLMVALKALLEEGNVTKAGAKIGKSQPAMSTALARLRRHYQDELLVRVGRKTGQSPPAHVPRPRSPPPPLPGRAARPGRARLRADAFRQGPGHLGAA